MQSKNTCTKDENYSNRYCIIGQDALDHGLIAGCSYDTVELEEGVTRIPSWTLAHTKIRRLILSSTVRTIDGGACSNSTLEEVLVRKDGAEKYNPADDHLEFVGTAAFSECKNLRFFEPKKVESFGNLAFLNTKLTEGDIVHPKHATFGQYVFRLELAQEGSE